MQTITVKEGQCALDIAVQYTGDAGQTVAMLALNNLSITDALAIGQQMAVQAADIAKQYIPALYLQKGIVPASMDDNGLTNTGIGYWRIGYDFVVS